jgi:hypothetical protein
MKDGNPRADGLGRLSELKAPTPKGDNPKNRREGRPVQMGREPGSRGIKPLHRRPQNPTRNGGVWGTHFVRLGGVDAPDYYQQEQEEEEA